MQKRRIEARRLCIDMMDVHWLDAEGKPQKAAALLDNVSASGARLRVPAPVPVDVEIRWYRSSVQESFWGRVRYCEPAQSGYSVGVELDPACIGSDNRRMHHENLSPGESVQARTQPYDPWTDWLVISTTDRLVTLSPESAHFVGLRLPDGRLEDEQGRRMELRQNSSSGD